MLVNLADWCFRRRRLVVVTWLGALVGSFLLAGALGGEFRQDYLQPGSESRAASETLEDTFPQRSGDTVQIVLHAEQGVTTPMVQASAEDLFEEVARHDDVVGIASPFAAGGAAQISDDGTTAYADVALSMTVNEYTPAQAAALVDPTPRGRRQHAAGRGRRPGGCPVAVPHPSAPRRSDSSRPPSSCWSPSAPPWRWDCRW